MFSFFACIENSEFSTYTSCVTVNLTLCTICHRNKQNARQLSCNYTDTICHTANNVSASLRSTFYYLLDLLLFRTFPDADIEPKRVNHKKKRKFIFISSGSFVCHHLHLNLQFKRHNKHYMVI